jgi:hemerythrin
LLTQLNTLTKCIANETFVKNDWQVFLQAWLIDHIENSDRKLLHYIKAHAVSSGLVTMPTFTYINAGRAFVFLS